MNEMRVARGLGWFSIGLGLAEIVAGREIGRTLGMEHRDWLIRAYGVREIASGVEFWGIEDEAGALAGVMGIQAVRDVDLIRHAYVRPGLQGGGIGRRLLEDLVAKAERPLLVGTWAAATWAIRFYERNGFELVGREEKDRLLATYWSIPDRQVETSVVLAHRPPGRPGRD